MNGKTRFKVGKSIAQKIIRQLERAESTPTEMENHELASKLTLTRSEIEYLLQLLKSAH